MLRHHRVLNMEKTFHLKTYLFTKTREKLNIPLQARRFHLLNYFAKHFIPPNPFAARFTKIYNTLVRNVAIAIKAFFCQFNLS